MGPPESPTWIPAAAPAGPLSWRNAYIVLCPCSETIRSQRVKQKWRFRWGPVNVSEKVTILARTKSKSWVAAFRYPWMWTKVTFSLVTSELLRKSELFSRDVEQKFIFCFQRRFFRKAVLGKLSLVPSETHVFFSPPENCEQLMSLVCSESAILFVNVHWSAAKRYILFTF